MKTRFAVIAGLALCLPVIAQLGQDSKSDPMKEWIKANMPGKNHAFLLGNMLGEWEAKSQFWMQPNSQPQSSTGTCVCTQQMTGRFVQMEHTGEMMGMPFKGLGYFGYDNATEKFQNVWMDSSSTGMMMSIGSKEGDNKLTWTGSYTDPMSKQLKTSRSTTTFTDRNTMVFEMFETWTDGTEFKTLEITYTRKPGTRENAPNSGGALKHDTDKLRDTVEKKSK
ncbi:MAG: DUF1579 domain-containing protein [Phycisphaerales bacterium]